MSENLLDDVGILDGQGERCRSFLITDVFAATLRDLDQLIELYTAQQTDSREVLQRAARIVDEHTTEAEAQAFKRALVATGANIAEASGPWLSDKVSTQERGALEAVAGALGPAHSLPAFLTGIAGADAGFVFVGAALERKS